MSQTTVTVPCAAPWPRPAKSAVRNARNGAVSTPEGARRNTVSAHPLSSSPTQKTALPRPGGGSGVAEKQAFPNVSAMRTSKRFSCRATSAFGDNEFSIDDPNAEPIEPAEPAEPVEGAEGEEAVEVEVPQIEYLLHDEGNGNFSEIPMSASLSAPKSRRALPIRSTSPTWAAVA